MSRRYYVLQDYADVQDLFEQVEDALDEVRRLQGLLFLYVHTEDQQHVRTHIWLEEKNKSALVKVVEDSEIPVRYLIIESTTQEETLRIAEVLLQHVRYWPLADLQHQAIQDMKKNPQKLVILALGTGEPLDQISFDILTSGLRHPDPQVRDAAAMASSLTRWAEFIPDLTALSQNDPVPEVRQMAALALNACQPSSPPTEPPLNNEGGPTP